MYAISNNGKSARAILNAADLAPGELLWPGDLPGNPGNLLDTGLSVSNGVLVISRSAFVPNNITNYQMKAQLDTMGKYDTATAAVAKLPATHLISRAWNNSPTFSRTGAVIAAVQKAIGWTDAQLDAFFIAAAQIND